MRVYDKSKEAGQIMWGTYFSAMEDTGRFQEDKE